ncbi:MAG: GDP-mannose 4,6-dehydratase [Pseudobdellovibrionaceae bacterium]
MTASPPKTALITGITGQDGIYLAQFLLEKGYTVHGLHRYTSRPHEPRHEDYIPDDLRAARRFNLHYGEMTDASSLTRIVAATRPNEIYNLAAQSHVHVSFETPEYTANTDAFGTLRLLESLRLTGLEKTTRFFQASTSELYGKARETPQTEKTPFYPRSPYAVAKLYAYWITVNYREAYGIFASNGILFNHESPLRGDEFVTQKIIKSALRIYEGKQDCLYLGNLDSSRDWGHARDYVEGMWKIMQAPHADDFILATGHSTTVRQFAQLAFEELGISVEWSGAGLKETGICARTGKIIVRVDPQFRRPTEVEYLIGDSSKAARELGWSARTSLSDLIKDMMNAAQKETRLRAAA